jgi:hypothetical protein
MSATNSSKLLENSIQDLIGLHEAAEAMADSVDEDIVLKQRLRAFAQRLHTISEDLRSLDR